MKETELENELIGIVHLNSKFAKYWKYLWRFHHIFINSGAKKCAFYHHWIRIPWKSVSGRCWNRSLSFHSYHYRGV